MAGSNTQPVAGSHESSVQELPSLHASVLVPTHCPCWQTSTSVQASWSSQGAALKVVTQPWPATQASSVQEF